MDGANGDLKYVHANGKTAGFAVTPIQISGASGDYSSIALDSAEHPQISYLRYFGGTTTIQLASNDGDSWRTIDPPDTLEAATYDAVPIGIDSGDQVYIGYVNGQDTKYLIYRQ